MQTKSIQTRATQVFILISALALLSVSIMAFQDPQSVMDLVGVKLTNNDAFSSIRGIYGGVGLALVVSLIYLMLRDIVKGLAFLTLLWGMYALSRIVTIFADGALGAFGRQWLVIESILCLTAAALLWANRETRSTLRSSRYEVN